MSGRVDGKIALISGAGSGLGQATAIHLAREGARIVATDIDGGTAEATAASINGEFQGAAVSAAHDVTSQEQWVSAVDLAASHFGGLDILVNNAGMSIRKPPHELELDEWNKVIDTNLTSAFVCSKLAYPALKASGNGKVINIGSMMSIFGASFATAYAASKGGIVQYTRACANAWAPDNIQVNAILPGWIDTDLTRGARQQVSGLHERVLARTPAGRWGDIDDFAGIAVFLASPASNFVTGTAIPVDGGFSVMA